MAVRQSWPEADLERVIACPACGATSRSSEYKQLTDTVFGCAPGRWDLWRCHDCRSVYLDPRPTPESIGAAYESYYTHSSGVIPQEPYEQIGSFRRLRRRLMNGYTNWRFSTSELPENACGIPVLMLLFGYRIRIDRNFRNLPRGGGAGKTLLDVGCGSGDFLMTARACGFETIGLEPDANAVESGRARGLEILQGGLAQFRGRQNAFDVITMSHVIEHVHDPRQAVSDAFRLLKPGGRLWVETPNVDGVGHRRYGQDWRGLEVPRHLTLFNFESLQRLLVTAGFANVTEVRIPTAVNFVAKESLRTQAGLERDGFALTLSQQAAIALDRLGELFPGRREFMTFVADKPLT